MLSPCEQIAKKIGELFICSSVNQYIRIETPFLYPDGDVIDLFYKEEGEYATLTDFGETLGWLQMQTVSEGQTAKQRQLISDICRTHGIELQRGMLIVRLKQSDDLAEAVVRLSQAALRISDIWFTFRGRAGESAVDEVEDLFQEHHISFERDPEITGKSGTVWTPNFRTSYPQRRTLIYVLSARNRLNARNAAVRTSAAWNDLSYLKEREVLRFISLFDDTSDVWTPPDYRLVEDKSEIAHLSQPKEFLEKLAS